VLPINVVVAATVPDIEAEGIAAAVAGCMDMALVQGRVVAVTEIGAILESTPLTGPCAVVLVGPDTDTEEPAEHYLIERPDFVVMRVNAPIGDVVRIALRGVGLQQLLAELRALVDHAGFTSRGRVAQFRPRSAMTGKPADTLLVDAETVGTRLRAAIDWIHATLRKAVAGLASGNGDMPGLTVTAATVVELLDATP
jgi:hypothetical protein